MPEGHPVVSFTFDDFPRPALLNGGRILERFNLAATYYASLGLMKQMTPTGEIFHPADLIRLAERGHELGCHTFDHCPAWETKPCAFEASIVRNAEALHRLAPAVKFRTHSYPITCPRPAIKRRLARHFACCRGGGQTFNVGKLDLNHLSAFFLEQSRDKPEAITKAIELNRQVGGWLIFATHDVCDRPTRFGCTPEFFEDIVNCVVLSGSKVLPVFKALQVIQARDGRQQL